MKKNNKMALLAFFITLILFSSNTVFCDENPAISFSPDGLVFIATKGEPNPDPKTLYIWNSGSGTLNWDIATKDSWLKISPNSGLSTDSNNKNTVTVSVDITELNHGVHEGKLSISKRSDSTDVVFAVTLIIKESEGNSGQGCYSQNQLLKRKYIQTKFVKYNCTKFSINKAVNQRCDARKNELSLGML